MSYPQIYQKVFNEPWLIEPSAHRAICRALLNHERAPLADREHGDSRKQSTYVDYDGREKKIEYYQRLGRIARVSIHGIIGKHLSLIETLCGGVDLATRQKGLEQAMADGNIDTVLLDLNTPGGTVTGVPEFAAMIRRAREVKQVVGFCETLACSAGQWLLSQCDLAVGTESARFGSIGVYRTWLDDTRANEMEGLDRELFEAGKHKAAGLRPITEEERGVFQAEVDAIHAEFKREVRRYREVPDEATEGLVYYGAEAMRLGLVDAFVDCFTDLEEMLNGGK
jgi:ClpP class serine protease